jgi:hypothetical protein
LVKRILTGNIKEGEAGKSFKVPGSITFFTPLQGLPLDVRHNLLEKVVCGEISLHEMGKEVI